MCHGSAIGKPEDYSSKVKSKQKMTLTKNDFVKSVMQNVRFKSRQKRRQRFLFPEMDCVFLNPTRANDIVNSLIEVIKENKSSGWIE